MNDFELKHVQDVLNEYCGEVLRLYRENLTESNRIASRNLYSNLHTQIVINNTTIDVILTTEDYMKYVEKGRGGGKFPPIVKIEKWITDKNILPRPDKNGKLPTIKQLAFLIGRKIAREGFEGSYDLEKTLEALNDKYISLLNKALEDDFNDYCSNILNSINNYIKIY